MARHPHQEAEEEEEEREEEEDEGEYDYEEEGEEDEGEYDYEEEEEEESTAGAQFGIFRFESESGIPVDDLCGLLQALNAAYSGIGEIRGAVALGTIPIHRARQRVHAHDRASDYLATAPRLMFMSAHVDSPGVWEFLGSLNIFTQIREYLKDRHERKKDFAYRNEAEKRQLAAAATKAEVDAVSGFVTLLLQAGYTEAEIRQRLEDRFFQPMRQLESFQDRGLLLEPEVLPLPASE
ncbi:hypothetical protein JK359_24005 [Streptomyces actinomycinicus]|uniref:Uncharacterized protein n=1 Tax=Streptomyces actinomycinicus TaxID=1695166 RepID=A0A937JMR9_9ACTN|nr:hypothetical protein [Streptomyces actinomycinicus]MBL1084999.1 hypothetical protein [Streptomyces actinomycinicus]